MISKKGIATIPVMIALIVSVCPFSRAYADYQTPVDGQGFLEQLADKAGLTPTQLVATIVGAATVSTGAQMVNGNGLGFGFDVAHNLDALIDAADYPSWDTLTTEQKNSWGTKANYDAAKLSSLLNAFGLNQARDAYYSSGGGNIDWTQDWTEKAQQIGRIGQIWSQNGYNTLSNIKSLITSSEPVEEFAGKTNYALINGSDYDNWPSNLPTSIYVCKGTFLRIYRDNSRYGDFTTSNEVYYIPYIQNTNSAGDFGAWVFDKVTFNYGYAENSYPSSPLTSNYDNQNYYYANAGSNAYITINQAHANMQLNILEYSQIQSLRNVIPLILFQDNKLSDIGNYQMIPDYPTDIQSQDGNTPIYYPTTVNNVTNWNNWTTNPASSGGSSADLSTIEELLRQFQFYANGILKVHDEGVFDSLTDLGTYLNSIQRDVSSILAKLSVPPDVDDIVGDFDFDALKTSADSLASRISSLAPFAAFALIAEMLAIWSQSGALQGAPTMDLAFNFMPGHQYQVHIDMNNMSTLEPIVNFLCISMLLLCLVNVSMRIIELEAAS